MPSIATQQKAQYLQVFHNKIKKPAADARLASSEKKRTITKWLFKMINMKKYKINRGFTLIEILVVIGIIGVLAAIVLLAINPARQFAQARNTQRESNLTAILNAIGQNIADNKGIFGGVCATTLPVTTASTSIDNGTGGTGKDLSCLTPTYVPSFPTDPEHTSGVDTLYDISVDSVGRVMVCAPEAAEPAIVGSVGICIKR